MCHGSKLLIADGYPTFGGFKQLLNRLINWCSKRPSPNLRSPGLCRGALGACRFGRTLWREAGLRKGAGWFFKCWFTNHPPGLHPGRLTWNPQITHLERKIILQTSVIMFHVNLPGCMIGTHHPFWRYEEGPQKYPKIVDDETIIFVCLFSTTLSGQISIATSFSTSPRKVVFFRKGNWTPFFSGKSRLVKY